jgi:hypothetical protein
MLKRNKEREIINYVQSFRIEEYKSLRQEILMILKRGYDIYFSTIALSIGLLGYGVNISDLTTSIIIILSPILVLYFGYNLILEQIKTLRRNASYIRIFYEGKKTGIHWETRLNHLREIRMREINIIKDITVVDILKGFPSIIDVLSVICFIVALVKVINIFNIYDWHLLQIIIIIIIFLFWLIFAIRRYEKSNSYKGGGKIEQEYASEWNKMV